MPRMRFKKSVTYDRLECGDKKRPSRKRKGQPSLSLTQEPRSLVISRSHGNLRGQPPVRRIFRFISDPEYLYQVFVEALAVCDPSHPVLRMSLRDRCPPYTPRAPGADKVQASGGAKTQYPEVQDGPKVAAEPLHDRQYRSNYLSQCHQPCKTQSVRSSRRHRVLCKHNCDGV